MTGYLFLQSIKQYRTWPLEKHCVPRRPCYHPSRGTHTQLTHHRTYVAPTDSRLDLTDEGHVASSAAYVLFYMRKSLAEQEFDVASLITEATPEPLPLPLPLPPPYSELYVQSAWQVFFYGGSVC